MSHSLHGVTRNPFPTEFYAMEVTTFISKRPGLLRFVQVPERIWLPNAVIRLVQHLNLDGFVLKVVAHLEAAALCRRTEAGVSQASCDWFPWRRRGESLGVVKYGRHREYKSLERKGSGSKDYWAERKASNWLSRHGRIPYKTMLP